jgi:exodeoxyribonuclease VII large subunit
VLGRGGGSAEDLWSFNEEVVADAIFAMQTPLVSAVGHEVDVMISDFVADLRAPTPSAAMEMILPDSKEVLYTLNEMNERFLYVIEQKLHHFTRDLKHAEELFLKSSPSRLLRELESHFQGLGEEFKRVIDYKMEHFSSVLPGLEKNYRQSVLFLLQQKEQHLDYMRKKFMLSDPKLQCLKGWAQISFAGKKVELSELEPDQKFILEDETTRIEALYVKKL